VSVDLEDRSGHGETHPRVLAPGAHGGLHGIGAFLEIGLGVARGPSDELIFAGPVPTELLVRSSRGIKAAGGTSLGRIDLGEGFHFSLSTTRDGHLLLGTTVDVPLIVPVRIQGSTLPKEGI